MIAWMVRLTRRWPRWCPPPDRAAPRRLSGSRHHKAVPAADSFFEIEQATLDGRAHQTCGGRSLNDDVIDKELTLLVNGGKGPRVSDGVDRPQTPVSDAFPYQAPPTHQPRAKQGLGLAIGQPSLARTATMTSKSTVVLELDDIQAGALEPPDQFLTQVYIESCVLTTVTAGTAPQRANPVSQLSCLLRIPRRRCRSPWHSTFRDSKPSGCRRSHSLPFPPSFGRESPHQRQTGDARRKLSRALGETAGFAGCPSRGGRARARLCPAWRPLSATPATPYATCPASCPSGNSTYTPQLTCATCSVSQMASAIRPSRVPAFPAPIRTKCRSRPASSSSGTRTRPTASPQYHSPKCWGSTAPTQSSAVCTRG